MTIWGRFSNLPNMQEFIEALANTKRKIRYREIVHYLREIYSSILLDEILKSHIDSWNHARDQKCVSSTELNETVVIAISGRIFSTS